MTRAPRNPTNPWMVGLTVLWSVVLLVAIVLAFLGGHAAALTYDQGGLPSSDVLAGISYACSGVAFAVALVIIAVQLAAAALRWHLDPTSRALEREIAAGGPRPARQDF